MKQFSLYAASHAVWEFTKDVYGVSVPGAVLKDMDAYGATDQTHRLEAYQ